MKRRHSMPFGAELTRGGLTRFRLWAPGARSVALVLHSRAGARAIAIERDSAGWCELVTAAPPGTRYSYRIDDGLEVPDPASRYNPEDVHGPSMVVDPEAFEWSDAAWRGRPWSEAVFYELHVGAFSPDGTFAGVERRLDHLAALGVTAIELMPLADFPGRRNWGYDGVLPFAPESAYGSPDDLKRLVCAAHARGLMVFADVVYNHFGPEGNYLHTYAPAFFTERHKTDWGAAINFDDEGSSVVRDFFVHNALYWLREYHIDGLRFDAVHAIADDSSPHILVELAERVRSGVEAAREIHLVLENDRNESRYLEVGADARPRWYNAQWNDDFHHAFHIALTGEADGYYGDYAGEPARHMARCLAEGFAYQGDPSSYRNGAPRGEPSARLPLHAFVTFLQNHDQIGNRALGERLTALAKPERLRAATAAWLLAPSPPLLFMGEEFGAATPFLFFCDFGPELAQAVTEGRRREFSRFEQFKDPAALEAIPDPNHPETFERSKLDWSSLERAVHAQWLERYRRWIAMRARHIVPRLAAMGGHAGEGEVLGRGAALVRWRLGDGSRLELRLNLSDDAARAPRAPAGELLMCEPEGAADALRAGAVPSQCAAYFLAPPDS
jgi:maltooligosyltrehalose trehalohydrolase